MRNQLLLLSFFIGVCSTFAYQAQAGNDSTLVVGTKLTAPFVMESESGELTGLSVDLWKDISRDMGIPYSFKIYPDVESLVGAVENGEVDLGMSALSITKEREERIDFTQPFYVSGLKIATRVETGGPFATLKQFFSIQFLKAIGALVLVIFIFGFLVWLAERRRNPDQFGDGIRGLGSGFWWSAVTMTTVGYGDKAPVTRVGRGVALVWMFLALIIFSGFTAAITSALTVDRLAERIDSPEDLVRVVVGTVAASNTEAYLSSHRIAYTVFATPEEALKALANGQVEAVVHDGPILSYLINASYLGELRLLPYQLQQFYYGMALPSNSELRDRLNVQVLEKTAKEEWADWKYHYMGTLED